jgi:hypothetical protein
VLHIISSVVWTSVHSPKWLLGWCLSWSFLSCQLLWKYEGHHCLIGCLGVVWLNHSRSLSTATAKTCSAKWRFILCWELNVKSYGLLYCTRYFLILDNHKCYCTWIFATHFLVFRTLGEVWGLPLLDWLFGCCVTKSFKVPFNSYGKNMQCKVKIYSVLRIECQVIWFVILY